MSEPKNEEEPIVEDQEEPIVEDHPFFVPSSPSTAGNSLKADASGHHGANHTSKSWKDQMREQLLRWLPSESHLDVKLWPSDGAPLRLQLQKSKVPRPWPAVPPLVFKDTSYQIDIVNISIPTEHQRKGFGTEIFHSLVALARELFGRGVFVEQVITPAGQAWARKLQAQGSLAPYGDDMNFLSQRPPSELLRTLQCNDYLDQTDFMRLFRIFEFNATGEEAAFPLGYSCAEHLHAGVQWPRHYGINDDLLCSYRTRVTLSELLEVIHVYARQGFRILSVCPPSANIKDLIRSDTLVFARTRNGRVVGNVGLFKRA